MTKLSDLRILDLSSVLAGPLAASFFAELGAHVTKVENGKTNGDVTRTWKLASENPAQEFSSYYASANYKKEVLLLDFADEMDKQQLKELIRESDIIISNFRAKTELKFELDYNSIKAINPSIVFGKIESFRKDSEQPAYDVILQAKAGFISMTGTDEEHLAKLPVAFIDVLASHQLREGILLALLERENSESKKVEVSLMDSALSALVNQGSAYLNTGAVAKPLGTAHPNIAPYGDLFKTKDGLQVLFAIGSETHWKKLCRAINHEALLQLYRSNHERVKNRQALIVDLQKALSKLSWKEIQKACIEHEIPVAKLCDIKEALDNHMAKELILEDQFGKRLKTVCFRISS